MADHFATTEPSEAELDRFIAALDYKEAEEVALVGAFVENGQVRQFWRHALTVNHPSFGPSYVAGSGSEMLRATLDLLPVLESPGHQTPEDLSQRYFNSAALGLIAAGLMLQNELYSDQLILHHFGGLMELVTFQGGDIGFTPLQDITYFFWDLPFDGQFYSVNLVPVFLKVSYVEDILLVARMELSSQQGGAPEARGTLIPIGPAHRTLTAAELQNLAPPSMASEYHCHMFCHADVNPPIRFGVVQRGLSQTFRLEDHPDGFKFRMDQEFTEKVRDLMLSETPDN